MMPPTDLSGLPEPDQARERRIRTYLDRMVYARTPMQRGHWLRLAEAEIAQRSPATVEYLERARNLAPENGTGI